jgi:hypothetical protein
LFLGGGAVWGFELRASHLLGRCSSIWTAPLVLFLVDLFWNRVSYLCTCWPELWSFSLGFPSCWDDRHVPPCLPFSVEMGSCEIFIRFDFQPLFSPSLRYLV